MGNWYNSSHSHCTKPHPLSLPSLPGSPHVWERNKHSLPLCKHETSPSCNNSPEIKATIDMKVQPCLVPMCPGTEASAKENRPRIVARTSAHGWQRDEPFHGLSWHSNSICFHINWPPWRRDYETMHVGTMPHPLHMNTVVLLSWYPRVSHVWAE